VFDTRADLLGALAATPDVLDALLGDLDPAVARAAPGIDGAWSAVEVAYHLRDAEEMAVERVRRMLDEDEPLLPGYDQEALAVQRDYAGAVAADVLAAFRTHRERQLTQVRALAPEAWARGGRHEQAGPITIEGYLAHLVAHDAQHLGQVARAIRAARATAPGDE
jgi:uncharacterized damage-inducible protein DinB